MLHWKSVRWFVGKKLAPLSGFAYKPTGIWLVVTCLCSLDLDSARCEFAYLRNAGAIIEDELENLVASKENIVILEGMYKVHSLDGKLNASAIYGNEVEILHRGTWFKDRNRRSPIRESMDIEDFVQNNAGSTWEREVLQLSNGKRIEWHFKVPRMIGRFGHVSHIYRGYPEALAPELPNCNTLIIIIHGFLLE